MEIRHAFSKLLVNGEDPGVDYSPYIIKYRKDPWYRDCSSGRPVVVQWRLSLSVNLWLVLIHVDWFTKRKNLENSKPNR